MRIRLPRFHSHFWAAALLFLVGMGFPGRGIAEDKVLMVVNGFAVKEADVDALLRITFGPTFSELSPDARQTVQINRGTEIRSQLLDRVLLMTAAEANGQTATEAEVNRQVDELKSLLPAGMTFEAYLEGTGLSLGDFRRYAKQQALINKLSALKTRGVKPATRAEIEAYYRENPGYFKRPERADVRHILISTGDAISDEQRAEKRAEAEIVRRKLMAAGADQFASLAREYSQCPSKEHGGGLGIIEKGAMVPAFDRAIFSQEVGAIGSVIRTQKGYHIIQVTERFPAENLTLADAEKDIVALLDFKAREAIMKSYLKQLRLTADVQIPRPENEVPGKEPPALSSGKGPAK